MKLMRNYYKVLINFIGYFILNHYMMNILTILVWYKGIKKPTKNRLGKILTGFIFVMIQSPDFVRLLLLLQFLQWGEFLE